MRAAQAAASPRRRPRADPRGAGARGQPGAAHAAGVRARLHLQPAAEPQPAGPGLRAGGAAGRFPSRHRGGTRRVACHRGAFTCHRGAFACHRGAHPLGSGLCVGATPSLGRLLRLELVFRFDRTTWPRRLAVACPASAPDKEGTADPSAASGPRCGGLALSSCQRLDFRGGSRPGAGRSLSCYCTETGWGGPGARWAAGGEAGVHMPMSFSRPRGGEPRLQRRTSGPRERV